MALDRAGLLALATLDREEVPVPGGSVFVRVMTAGERDKMEEAFRKAGSTGFRSRLIAATACDPAGSLLFGPEHLPEVSRLPYTVAEPIVEAAIRLNRMGADEKRELGKDSAEAGTSG
jgi:hypothetical protein